MSNEKLNLTTPIGRFVQGSLTDPNTTDAEGNALVVKHGPNAGQPRVEYFMAIAIPKGSEQSWKQTEWGQQIVAVAQRDFPSLFDPNTGDIFAGRQFAWKIDDGDSQAPNQRGTRNCDREGFPGHWIMRFSSGYAPSTYNHNGSLPEAPESFYRGCYVQINGNISGNGNTNQPGLYLNLSMVALSGHGDKIQTGPDPKAAGFGQGAAPSGMSTTPTGGMPAGAQQPAPQQPGNAGPAPTPQPQQPVQPATDLVQPQQPGNAGPAPTPPAGTNPPAPAPQPEPERYSVQGNVYTADQLKAAGWSDDQIAQQQRA